MTKLKASETGLKIVDTARHKKNWSKKCFFWAEDAKVSSTTLGRFWMKKNIEEENFIAQEQYGNNPFEVVFDTSHLQPVNVEFKVQVLSASKFAIQVEADADLGFKGIAGNLGCTHKMTG